MPDGVEAPRPLDSRVLELDGLRGVAILLVLIWHYVSLDPHVSLKFWALRPLWSGVDLFFVLSGFLIGGILIDARQSPRLLGTLRGVESRADLDLRRVLAVAIAMRTMLFLSFPDLFWPVYVLTPCRMDALMPGVLVAIVVRDEQARTIVRRRSDVLWVLAFGLAALIGYMSRRGWMIGSPQMSIWGYTVLAWRGVPRRTSPKRAAGSAHAQAAGRMPVAMA